jgi:branched-chain amino acid transport system substrate-binding protein
MRAVAVAVGASLASVFAISGVSGAATAGTAPGVTANSVDLGFIYSKTGAASATSGDSDVGCKARVGRENAAGGVNGRKISVEYEDDATADNTTPLKDLAQNKKVFAVIDDSALAFLSYRTALDIGIPFIGGGYDGVYYGQPGNEKIISAFGNQAPVEGVTYDTTMKLAKSLGGTKVASVGYGISPSSTIATKAVTTYAAPAVGLKPVYTNTSVDFGSTDVSPIALGIKNSGANVASYQMNGNTNLAIVSALAQNGVKMKAQFSATGYGQDLLDQPVASTLTPDVLFTSGWAPVELKTKATKQMQADLKKYADYTGVPDFGIYTGYIDCDMVIAGLAKAGNNLDQATFPDAMRSLGKFNPGGGLGCSDIDLSASSYGQQSPTQCTYAMQVKNGKFVVLKPKGTGKDYWEGKLIGKSVTDTTTTTAAAS